MRFLLKLSEIDSVALVSRERPGDVANLCSDLMRFGLTVAIVDKPGLNLQVLVKQVTAHPKRTLGPLIVGVKKLLDAVADSQTFQLPVPAASHIVLDGGALKSFESQGFEGPLAWRMGAGTLFTFRLNAAPTTPKALAAVFLFSAMRQLDSEQGVMVRRCRRESCRRVFLASRPKQVYCTRQCTLADNFKRYVDREGADNYREYHREVARKSYGSTTARARRH